MISKGPFHSSAPAADDNETGDPYRPVNAMLKVATLNRDCGFRAKSVLAYGEVKE